MKLISLNTWGGQLYEPLMEFIKSAADTTDIFCFQEVYFSRVSPSKIPLIRANLIFELKNLLSDFLMFGRLAAEPTNIQSYVSDKDIRIGEAIFIKKSAKVIESGGFHTFSEDDESVREKIEAITGNFQFIKFKTADETYLVGNIHGLWLPDSKFDTPKRIEQSDRLKEFIKSNFCKTILCGDFNLNPETKSISMLERDMRNLIKEYEIQTTRNSYYSSMGKYNDYVADYIFISPNVRVANFKVLTNEVSDHLPLFLDFS